MTLPEFANLFAVLAIQLRQTDADEATIRGYYKALDDLDLELVQMAAERLAASSEWFPKTSEWRMAVDKIRAERTAQLDETLRQRRKLGQPLCLVCEDTGWKTREDNRVERCECRQLRQLEIIGRRPLPLLPESAA